MATDGEIIKGTVETTSQYGIKVNGEWYNPHGKAKDFMSSATKDSEVEMTMTGHKNDFRFIRVTSQGQDAQTGTTSSGVPTGDSHSNTPARNSVEYWEKKEQRDIERDLRVSRHGAINTAKDILGPIKSDANSKDFGVYMLKASTIANLVLMYVQDGKYQEEYLDMAGGVKKETKNDDETIPEEDVGQ